MESGSSDLQVNGCTPVPPQHNLAPWEISVFEPADFFQYGVSTGLAGLGDLGGPNALPATDNWLAGTGGDTGFAIDLAGLNWSAGTRPAPDNTFGFSDVMQNDVFGTYLRSLHAPRYKPANSPTPDQLLATTLPPTSDSIPFTMSAADISPYQPSSSSSLSPDLSPDLSPEPVGTSASLSAESVVSRNPRKRSPPVDPETALKRQRNNIAARKYRQKKIDRISELEAELKEVKDDRDDLRVRLARQEAEAAALRSLLKIKAGVEI